MEKCYFVIIDCLKNKNFNSKKAKFIINSVITSDSSPFDIKKSFLERNVEVIEFDQDCDNSIIEEALSKEHIFLNIVGTSAKQAKRKVDIVYDDKVTKAYNEICFHHQHINVLNHAFTTRSRNALYIMVHDDLTSVTDDNIFESWIEINWFGFKTQICSDQLIYVSNTRTYETEIKKWILLKLISLEGNFTFFTMASLSKVTSCYGGLEEMDESALYIDECSSNTQDYYSGMVTSLLSTMDFSTPGIDFNRPMFLYADGNVEWRVVKGIIHSQFSYSSNYIAHYQCRLHNVYQDINLLLVYLLRFFKIVPQDNKLPFTTLQMATLVNECFRTGSSLSKLKKFIFFIEDIDWLSSHIITGQACSWLPEKCAPNIHIILTANKDSLQQKSLKSRLTPPIFIDLSFPKTLFQKVEDPCSCETQWCVSRLLQSQFILESILKMAEDKGVSEETVLIMTIFYCSFLSSLSRSQIDFILTHVLKKIQKNSADVFEEKDSIEEAEKSMMDSTKFAVSWPKSDHTDKALSILIQSKILSHVSLRGSPEKMYSLAIPQLKMLMAPIILDRVQPDEIEMIKCCIGAFFVYHSTNFREQILFIPAHLQYLSSIKDVVLKDWLMSWVVLVKFADEYSVPVRLLSLWRSILGSDTDYIAMINAYITTCLSSNESSSNCLTCQSLSDVPLQHGSICLDKLLQPTIDLSKKTTRHRCKILLELARLAMQVGQYSVAKDMGRVLLKLLDHSANHRSLLTIPEPDKSLLASCLHLLFSTLDERLKTFEFVTEQTTPIFRRTVHYGARALLVQNSIVEQLQRTLTKHSSYGSGDSQPVNIEMLQQKLCSSEVRLARIMTHFVFSLDGVEQTAINRHFLPSKIKAVTSVCMTRAYEIATRLRDNSLLLEIQMTFGVIQPRENCKEKILLYKSPLRQALIAYGQSHIFVSRIYINIAISYEEQKRYIKAYEYFTLWSHITHELLGRRHCKSIRSCGVFKEPIFKITAEFIEALNGESANDSLEDELTKTVGHVVENDTDLGGNELSVEGVRIVNPPEAENVSLENMFAFRNSLEQESAWEIHSSDDETPNYTTAFEEVIATFQKKSTPTMSRDLLHSFLDSNIVDVEDLTEDDIVFLYQSHDTTQTRLDLLNPNTQRSEGSVMEAMQISRVFRGLQDLSHVLPNSSSSNSEINLARRLLELQRDLQNFLNI